MYILHVFRVGLWAAVILTVPMAFGSIWIFMRMAPAIEVIIDRNGRSLQACEEMLSYLVYNGLKDQAILESSFKLSLKTASTNITELGEEPALEKISANYLPALQGDKEAIKDTVKYINVLIDINRKAMKEADAKAKQIGSAGAWGIVFMGTLLFFIWMLLIRYFKLHIADVLEELTSVLRANKHGDSYRRCFGDQAEGSHFIYDEVNRLLDKTSENNKEVHKDQ